MSVITISRGSFSGGKLLAECLSQRLGYRCVDRDVIVERAAAFGASQQELRDALQKPPGFLERFQHKRYLYLALIQAALSEEVRDGRSIYHGNAGHLLLKGVKPVLRVRVIATMSFRIAQCRERLHLSDGEAVSYIEKTDEDRRRWTQYLYGVDWRDPSLYDIVLNLENMSIRDACQVLASLVRQQKCFEFDEQCRAALGDVALASRIKANLALDPATADLEVEVTAEAGCVSVKGRLSNPGQLKHVDRIAREIPGVAHLNLDLLG
ncbi:MAG: cytidylate kinase family protein [Acidobacteria bacterium]|nr:cytidylate kinase family protein [Acidobacteriota bacterium]